VGDLPLNTKVSPAAELNKAFTLVSVHNSASLPSVPGGSCVVVFLPDPWLVLSSSLSDPSPEVLAPYRAWKSGKKNVLLITSSSLIFVVIRWAIVFVLNLNGFHVVAVQIK